MRYLTAIILSILLIFSADAVVAQNSQEVVRLPVLSTIHKKLPSAVKKEIHSSLGSRHTSFQIIKDRSAKKRPSSRKGFSPTKTSLRKVSARSAIVVDVETGKALYSKSADQPRQPASTIKVLTGLVALEALKERDLVPVSRRAARMPRSKIYLDQRKSYQAGDLINAVLLASANDASVALAEKIAGSEKEFSQLMTRKARELGAKKTVCKTASGLTVRGQQTTARDLAIIFGQAMECDDFVERVKRLKTKTQDGKVLWNHNKALWRISGAEGGKTGYTRAAKQTYVGKFRRGNDALVVAIMGSTAMWKDVRKLVEYGFSKKQKSQVAKISDSDFVQARKRKIFSSNNRSSNQNNALKILSDTKKVAKL